MLELAQVAEIVLDRQAPLARPAERFTQLALRDPHPCLQRRDRPHVGEEVAHVQALGLVEQVERAVQIAFGLPDPRHRDAPAIPVLRQPGVLAQLLAPQQVLRGGGQVVPLAVELAHADVHVRRSPQHRPARLRTQAATPARRCAWPRGDDPATPDVRQRDRAAEGVGDVPGPLQARHALGVPRVRRPRDPRSPRTRAPGAPLPLRGRGGRPQARGRAPAGRAARCRAHRPEPGRGRRGTARSPPGGGGIPRRRRRPSPPLGLGILHRCLSPRPATARRPAGGPRRPRARRRPAAPRHTRR